MLSGLPCLWGIGRRLSEAGEVGGRPAVLPWNETLEGFLRELSGIPGRRLPFVTDTAFSGDEFSGEDDVQAISFPAASLIIH